MILKHPSNVGAFKEDCDYSKGKWVWDTERNIYNSSEWICPTRPTGYNCEMNGKDLEYLNWRWKPDGCELPKFEPYSFLNIIRGKTLAFVGDSLSLNQLNSLLCLVSQIYLYEGGKLIGCINCKDEKKLTKHETKFGLQKAFKTVFQYISKCEECKELFTLLRTYSPSHFEKGSWFDGGYCRRSHPLENEENAKQKLRSQWKTCEEFREVQLEELGRVRRNEEGGRKRYGVVDVSRASMLRVDAHPGFYYSNLVGRNVTDCLHWCMPGPPDMWNEILLEILKKDSIN
ncbi:protein ALTERED XYLOGLUCAN 4-like [Dioscorea cayenensis subsp. rotundata]|uniref:Protein ALTERED XYLOGLUCAN 4-like n=1 Tax=Dioscorea cayennensis subsp. rotundata TaxID=55577 RepID=A0AB40AI77_DIOCR|nr:protein ALTERED XYLOGLUCAN 4-like [Dioscorea cayenensis subsp. rotundata]